MTHENCEGRSARAKSGYFISDDGMPLFVRRWEPAGSPKATVHIAHGLGEHGGRYETTAVALNQRGYTVIAHDHRGHGMTAGAAEKLGFIALKDGWRRAVHDWSLLIERERADNPALPSIVLGHSMGSFMALNILFQYPGLADACALSGTAGKPAIRERLLRATAILSSLAGGRRGRSKMIHSLCLRTANRRLRPRRTDFDWLSRDEAVVDEYVADPFCAFVGANQLWLDLLHGAYEATRPENMARIPKGLPIYIFAGTHDAVGRECRALEKLVADYRRAGLSDIRYRFYAEGRHEMLNETNREEVVRDLSDWLDDVVRKKVQASVSEGNPGNPGYRQNQPSRTPVRGIIPPGFPGREA